MCDRYRTMLQEVEPGGVPPTDHLYIDVDDVLATYLHWSEEALKQTEEQILYSVTKYIDFLVETIQPKTELFISTSGVQPAAFLNVERGRRIYNKRKVMDLEFRKAVHVDDASELFSMNACTPGTEFMERLDAHFLFFVRHQMSVSLPWKHLRVLYSGSTIAGDSTYKIFESMRSMRCDRGMEDVLTHCIYSTKHDTPLRVLASREPFCYIMKEKTFFRNPVGVQRGQEGELKEEDFVVQYMNLFRECWEQELKLLSSDLDVDRTLDDFLLLCTFLGNNALPGVPTLHLLEGSLDELLSCYKEFLAPALDALHLNHGQSECALSVSPYLVDKDRSISLMNLQAYIQLIGTESKEINRLQFREKLQSSGQAPKPQGLISQDAVGIIYYEQRPYDWWKSWYYTVKLKFPQGRHDPRKDVAGRYLNGIVWYFDYLTKGIHDWDYFYREVYAPTLSDLGSAYDWEVDLPEQPPMSRLEYLLCVLPAADFAFLPKTHQCLMAVEKSPYAKFYKNTRSCLNYKVDAEGAWSEKEEKLLIEPFNFSRIKRAIGAYKGAQKETWEDLTLLDDGFQHIFVPDYRSSETIYCKSTLPSFYPDVEIPPRTIVVRSRPIRKLNSGVRRSGPLAPSPNGFPSLSSVLQLNSSLLKMKYDRNGDPSVREALVIEVSGDTYTWPGGAKKIFDVLKEKTVLIGFPCQTPATVIGATDAWSSYSVPSRYQRQTSSGNHAREYQLISNETKQRLWIDHGINIGKCGVVLHLIVKGDLLQREVHYPVQLTVVPSDEGFMSGTRCLFQPEQVSTAVRSHVNTGNVREEDEEVPGKFGPVEPDMLFSLPVSEAPHVIPAVDSSYSTYMESQVFEDDMFPEQQSDHITQDFPQISLAEDNRVSISDSGGGIEEQLTDPTDDQAIQRAYDEEIRLALNNAGNQAPLEPWREESQLSGTFPDSVPIHESLERSTEGNRTESNVQWTNQLADDGYVCPADAAQELGISVHALVSVLSYCKLRTSTGESVDVGLGLEAATLQPSSWLISPELKAYVEDYQTRHLWLFCLLDSEITDDDDHFRIETVVTNRKLEAKYLDGVLRFLQGFDHVSHRIIELAPETAETEEKDCTSATELTIGDSVKCLNHFESCNAEWAGRVVEIAEGYCQVMLLMTKERVWIDKASVRRTLQDTMNPMTRGFDVRRTRPNVGAATSEGLSSSAMSTDLHRLYDVFHDRAMPKFFPFDD